MVRSFGETPQFACALSVLNRRAYKSYAPKQGLTIENGITTLKTAVSFAKAWKDLAGESTSTTSRATRQVVGVMIANFADIVLGVIDFYKLGAVNGDWDAAVVRGGGAIVMGAVLHIWYRP